ncbi:hypothetical protein RHMOL_Rhmol05G0100700 [Rhododendron molle]|uniref:Uncharacterized protein n=1 Tax=Rhododendron molle TaxID=49168 RepID=A0ACC0NND2_RHOML|nr:hypothetical protein RHMOL_Rhmol05G0100700 [Rhododendron molle]
MISLHFFEYTKTAALNGCRSPPPTPPSRRSPNRHRIKRRCDLPRYWGQSPHLPTQNRRPRLDETPPPCTLPWWSVLRRIIPRHCHYSISQHPVDYRLAPEHPLPTAYDGSWFALQWIATHLNGKGPELWLNEYVDFGQIFLMGDSAGANIAHHMAVRVGATGLEGFKVSGAVIVHPYFADSEPDKMIQFLYPGSSGTESDPKLNPKADPDLDKMGCEKVLVLVAEKDWLKSRGMEYCETLKSSGWKGNVELVENEGEDHVFYKLNPTCEKTLLLMQKLASFARRSLWRERRHDQCDLKVGVHLGPLSRLAASSVVSNMRSQWRHRPIWSRIFADHRSMQPPRQSKAKTTTAAERGGALSCATTTTPDPVSGRSQQPC